MLPGKKYVPEDFLRIAWARKWLIVLPTVVIASATFVWSWYLPDRYHAETTILVVPQRIPASYVRSTVTAELGERLNTISQQIVTRTKLERIIEEFNLYPSERQTRIMEDIVERMRLNDIKINTSSGRGEAASFTVGFESSNPRTAVQVAERLASMFVQENLQERELQADSTSQFILAQLEDARRRLIEHEKKLEDFRQRNAGRLPSQVSSNLQVLQSAQVQLQAIVDATNRDRDRLLLLETGVAESSSGGGRLRTSGRLWLRAEEIDAAKSEENPAGGRNQGDAPATTAAQQLDGARAALRNLELRLKPDHPDIKRAQRIIKELEVKAEAEVAAVPVAPESEAGQSQAGQQSQLDRNLRVQIEAMRLEVVEIRARIENRKQEEARLKERIALYTTRVESSPSLESALTELMRDYSTIQGQYQTLLGKAEDSKLAVNLERRQIGEQFKIIDGARLPERPISPNRPQINLMGLFAGLGLGLALAALREYRDTTFKTDDDIVTSLALPVLAVIPLMITTRERRRIKRRRLLLAISGSVASLLLIAFVVVWKLQLVQDWVR